MDWQERFLTVLKESRPAWDEPGDWRAALALYEGLSPAEAAELDRTVLQMIRIEYRNPHASHEQLPFDDVMVNLPAGMTPDDLLCIEGAVLVAAERGLGEAFFAFNRLMRLPTWHILQGRLQWLSREGFDAQRKLGMTRAGRGAGALLGLAAGDALGCTLEFMSREAVRAAYPQGHRDIVGGGPFQIPPGGWTDDTEMSLGVARGIIEAPADPVDAVGRHFMAWFRSGPRDVGTTCREALVAFQRTGSWEAAAQAVAQSRGDRAGGNGALMRTLPAAVAYGERVEEALRIGRMTHPHPESDAAVAAYHRMVNALLDGGSKEEALRAAVAAAGPLAERLADLADRPEDAIASSGYVVHTLEAAIWSFLRTGSLEECLVTAVNLGDDADTVGAVAGGLAGAAYGPFAVPRRWSLKLSGRGELEELAEGLYQIYLTQHDR
ncbi:MAG: ADP-ribosylglycohydrolase family protein [Bacillota bacterium]